jgi:hypothetical protein
MPSQRSLLEINAILGGDSGGGDTGKSRKTYEK